MDTLIELREQNLSKGIAPVVSICCLTFNHEDFISKTINGFLSQKIDFPVEIIIHDDASTDKTRQTLRIYKNKYPHLIHLISQNTNQYSQGNTPIFGNFIYPKAKGKYIAICDGDDFWTHPYKLQKQVRFLEENPSFAGCFTNFSIIDEENNLIKKDGLDASKKKILSHQLILGDKTPKTFTSMIRSSALPEKYPKVFQEVKNGDTILFAMASEEGPFQYLDFICGNYRVHSGGVWSSMIDEYQRKNQIIMAKKMLSHFKSNKDKKAIKRRIIRSYRALVAIYMHNKKYLRAIYYSLRYGWYKLNNYLSQS